MRCPLVRFVASTTDSAAGADGWAADVIGAQAPTSRSSKFKTMRKVARNCLVYLRRFNLVVE
jgi:hypothetical protein